MILGYNSFSKKKSKASQTQQYLFEVPSYIEPLTSKDSPSACSVSGFGSWDILEEGDESEALCPHGADLLG